MFAYMYIYSRNTLYNFLISEIKKTTKKQKPHHSERVAAFCSSSMPRSFIHSKNPSSVIVNMHHTLKEYEHLMEIYEVKPSFCRRKEITSTMNMCCHCKNVRNVKIKQFNCCECIFFLTPLKII